MQGSSRAATTTSLPPSSVGEEAQRPQEGQEPAWPQSPRPPRGQGSQWIPGDTPLALLRARPGSRHPSTLSTWPTYRPPVSQPFPVCMWRLFVPQCLPAGGLCSADWATKSCWSRLSEGGWDAPGAGPHSPLPPGLSGAEVQWCTTSEPEQQKCSDMSKAFQGAGIQPSLLCVQGTSADHCIQLITVSPLLPLCHPARPPDRRPLTQEGAHNGLIHWQGH